MVGTVLLIASRPPRYDATHHPAIILSTRIGERLRAA
jgi:hypothetical protein